MPIPLAHVLQVYIMYPIYFTQLFFIQPFVRTVFKLPFTRKNAENDYRQTAHAL